MTATGIGLMLLVLALGSALGYWVASLLAGAERRQLEAEQLQLLAQRDGELAISAQRTERLEGELDNARSSVERAEKQAQQDRTAKVDLQEQILPMQTALQQLDKQIHDAETRRQKAQGELQEQVKTVGQQLATSTKEMSVEVKSAARDVRQEAQRLNSALSSSGVRGSWGEMRLEQIVESAGMIEHVHYVTQDQQSGGDSSVRPDMIVDLAGGRSIVVDSKVSLDSFLHLADDATEQDYEAALVQHGEAVAKHVKSLSSKKYWEYYNTPEMVVMFMPAESLLSLALQQNPGLMQQAFEAKVVPATPTTLVAILNTASYAWQQETIARNASEIMSLATELHTRLRKMGDHFTALGSRLSATVEQYNKTVGSLESRVLPQVKRVSEYLGMESLEAVELTNAPRQLNPSRWDSGGFEEEQLLGEVADLANPTAGGQSQLHDRSA